MKVSIKGRLPKPKKFEAAKALLYRTNHKHHSRELDVAKGRSRKPKHKGVED